MTPKLTTTQRLRNRFLQLDKKLKTVDAQHTQALRDWQKACGHLTVYEVPSRDVAYSDHGGSAPPQRVCAECGLHETTWTFRHLKPGKHDGLPQITQRRFLELIRGVEGDA